MNMRLQRVVQSAAEIEELAARVANELDGGDRRKAAALSKTLVRRIKELNIDVYNLEKDSAIVDVIRAAIELRSVQPAGI